MDNYQKAHNECSGKVQHHWSYLPENHLNIILLSKKFHGWLHKRMRLDKELLCYRTDGGELLDTREKHEMFIKSLKYEEKMPQKETFTDEQIAAHRRFLSFNYIFRTFQEKTKVCQDDTKPSEISIRE